MKKFILSLALTLGASSLWAVSIDGPVTWKENTGYHNGPSGVDTMYMRKGGAYVEIEIEATYVNSVISVGNGAGECGNWDREPTKGVVKTWTKRCYLGQSANGTKGTNVKVVYQGKVLAQKYVSY
ncbi:hypothetical protein DMB92_08855 [Campylobacter sp. MIT 99-7217]|uniref:hypothetical protein n=1 Tax=Campylobacter sp. MIT 99-7217 TaxID=535091 RepID=UPI00115843CD|nr:hypothetical protein [Campylobacter sp. MIT 99-7217]TQR28935.1 hypothetical protein DMB92_08855 [Campylobacter sp. MIT 99-7217]